MVKNSSGAFFPQKGQFNKTFAILYVLFISFLACVAGARKGKGVRARARRDAGTKRREGGARKGKGVGARARDEMRR